MFVRLGADITAESAEVISPGTAITSRPSSSAKSAVISAPERYIGRQHVLDSVLGRIDHNL